MSHSRGVPSSEVALPELKTMTTPRRSGGFGPHTGHVVVAGRSGSLRTSSLGCPRRTCLACASILLGRFPNSYGGPAWSRTFRFAPGRQNKKQLRRAWGAGIRIPRGLGTPSWQFLAGDGLLVAAGRLQLPREALSVGYSRGGPSSEGTLAGEAHDNPSSLWRLGAPRRARCHGQAFGASPHLFDEVAPADALGRTSTCAF